MGRIILQLWQQGIVSRLLFCRQADGLVFERNGRIQVDGLVHLAAFQHAFGAQVIQHGTADALVLQLVQGAGPAAQQCHCRQLLGSRFGLLRQPAHKAVRVLCVAGELLLQHRRHTVCCHSGLVLRTIGNDRLDRFIIGAEGAFLQKVHQTQQLRRQAGRSRGHVEKIFQLCTFRFGITGQHHTHAGAAAPAKGHQHHAAQLYGVLLVRHDRVGIQLIKVEGRIADGNTYRFGHSSSSFKCYSALPMRRQIASYSASAQVSTRSLTSFRVNLSCWASSCRAVARRS